MEDSEFYDFVYQGWGKTTGAEDTFWMYEDESASSEIDEYFVVYAVNEKQERTYIAGGFREADAAFLCALHGAIPDMTRQLLNLTDENDRLDAEKDNVISELAEAYLREQELMKEIESLKNALEEYEGAEDG